MTKDTTKEAAVAAEALLFDDWFDAIEDGVRARVRGLIETMLEEELCEAFRSGTDRERELRVELMRSQFGSGTAALCAHTRRSSPFVFDSALVAYFKLLRIAAQACGTPESTSLLPGIIAQPPFSTYAACCHESVFFSSVRLLAASAPRWN